MHLRHESLQPTGDLPQLDSDISDESTGGYGDSSLERQADELKEKLSKAEMQAATTCSDKEEMKATIAEHVRSCEEAIQAKNAALKERDEALEKLKKTENERGQLAKELFEERTKNMAIQTKLDESEGSVKSIQELLDRSFPGLTVE